MTTALQIKDEKLTDQRILFFGAGSAGIGHAYRRAEWRRAHYVVFQTGPSATADIEGMLIHGAQAVRSLSVLPLARR